MNEDRTRRVSVLAAVALTLLSIATPITAQSPGEAVEGTLVLEDGVEIFYRRIGNGPPVVIPNAIYLERDLGWLANSHTVVFYDLRNRGRSSKIIDPDILSLGIHADVADLEKIREHFGFERIHTIGHSYVALVVALWSLDHKDASDRLVLIGAPSFSAQSSQQYSQAAARTPVMLEASKALAEWMKKGAASTAQFGSNEAIELCREYWKIFARIMVGDSDKVGRVYDHAYCELSNEQPLVMMNHLASSIMPTIQSLEIEPETLAMYDIPTLVVHGTEDRNAPLPGGRDWARHLGEARLLEIEGAGHLPFLEQPRIVRPAIETFLAGKWPADARIVED